MRTVVSVPAELCTEARLEALKTIIRLFPGDEPFELILSETGRTPILLGEDYDVDGSPALLMELFEWRLACAP